MKYIENCFKYLNYVFVNYFKQKAPSKEYVKIIYSDSDIYHTTVVFWIPLQEYRNRLIEITYYSYDVFICQIYEETQFITDCGNVVL